MKITTSIIDLSNISLKNINDTMLSIYMKWLYLNHLLNYKSLFAVSEFQSIDQRFTYMDSLAFLIPLTIIVMKFIFICNEVIALLNFNYELFVHLIEVIIKQLFIIIITFKIVILMFIFFIDCL